MKQKSKTIILNILPYLFAVIILAGFFSVMFYGMKHNWFTSFQQQTVTQYINQTQQPQLYKSCSELCSANSFSYTYNLPCQGGENNIKYGYPNQAPILDCCCANDKRGTIPPPEPQPQYTCTDSDGKNNFAVSGHCQDSYHQLGFQDKCEGNNVVDYYCDENNICQKSIQLCAGDEFNPNYCDNGKCFPTPSQDYQNSPNSLCYNACYGAGFGTGKWIYDWTMQGICTQESTQEICSYVGGVNRFEVRTASGATCCCWCCHNNVKCH